jgi:hypothetical protein
MSLPIGRLVRAGATDPEIAQLQAEHEEATPAERTSLLTRLEGIVDQDIHEWLQKLRADGHFGKPAQAETEEETPELETEKPAAKTK